MTQTLLLLCRVPGGGWSLLSGGHPAGHHGVPGPGPQTIFCSPLLYLKQPKDETENLYFVLMGASENSAG